MHDHNRAEYREGKGVARKPVHLYLDEDLVKEARAAGLNLSRFVERALREYLSGQANRASLTNPPERGQRENRGGPGGIRTPDFRLRRPTPCPG